MRKLKYLLITLFALIVIPFGVNAASGTVRVTGSSQVVVGNRITLTVTSPSSGGFAIMFSSLISFGP